jgi:hypothetical protein
VPRFARGHGVRALLPVAFLAKELTNCSRKVLKDGVVSPIRGERAMFADFIASLTKNRLSQGHSNDYYMSDPGNATCEMFANYVCLTSGPGANVYRALMHAMAPKCCAEFDAILDDVAYPKRIP